jgi:hypothetical protein
MVCSRRRARRRGPSPPSPTEGARRAARARAASRHGSTAPRHPPPRGRRSQGGRGRAQREVRVVLVVDRVVLPALDQPQQVWELKRHGPGVGSERPQSADEVEQVGHVREHVVGHHEVGRPVPLGDGGAGPLAEEHPLRRRPARPRGVRDTPAWLDAENPDPARNGGLEEVAVVARRLDDEAPRAEAQLARHVVDETAGVVHPAVGVGGEVGVVGREDLLRRDVGRQLHEQAAVADPDVERVGGLRLVELVGPQVALARRRHPQVDERAHERRRAQAARMVQQRSPRWGA